MSLFCFLRQSCDWQLHEIQALGIITKSVLNLSLFFIGYIAFINFQDSQDGDYFSLICFSKWYHL